jgi:hypothetical protein
LAKYFGTASLPVDTPVALRLTSPLISRNWADLFGVAGPLKFFDVNQRPPFADPKRIVELAARADVLKLNHDEIGHIASNRTGHRLPPGRDRRVA